MGRGRSKKGERGEGGARRGGIHALPAAAGWRGRGGRCEAGTLLREGGPRARAPRTLVADHLHQPLHALGQALA